MNKHEVRKTLKDIAAVATADKMSVSRQEEIISILWIIASVLCFGFSFQVLGWICAVKATIDTITSILLAIMESKKPLPED